MGLINTRDSSAFQVNGFLGVTHYVGLSYLLFELAREAIKSGLFKRRALARAKLIELDIMAHSPIAKGDIFGCDT